MVVFYFVCCESGAEDGSRTRYLQLGRLSLCQMSYFRKGMWEGEDSNLRRLRQQIYSLPHLTALVPSQLSRQTDSNRRPADYKSAALPTELHRLENFTLSNNIHRFEKSVCKNRLFFNTNHIFRLFFIKIIVSHTLSMR